MGNPNEIKAHGLPKEWNGSDWESQTAFSNAPCPGSCHSSPKDKPFSGKSTSFFADAAASSPLLKQGFQSPGIYNPALLKWIDSQKKGADEKPSADPATAPAVEKPDEATVKKFTALAIDGETKAAKAGIPDDEKILHLTVAFSAYQRAGNGEKAQEIRKKIQSIYSAQGLAFDKLSSKIGLKPEQQLDLLSRSVSCYRAAQDPEKVKGILERMRAVYETQGNEVGKAMVGAELAFLNWDPKSRPEGLGEAIGLYEKLDNTLRNSPQSLGLKEDQIAQVRGELQSKLYGIYMKRGEWLASQGRYGEAEKDLYQALLLQPSKPLLQIYLQVGYQAGLYNFAGQDSKRVSLDMKEMRQSFSRKPAPCASHHKKPDDWYSPWGGPIYEGSPEFDPNIQTKISEHRRFMAEGRARFHAAIDLVHGADASSKGRYERDLLTAEALDRFGRPLDAELLYQKIVDERKDSTDPAEKTRRALAENRLGAYALQRRDFAAARTHAASALEASKDLGESEKHFIAMQAKMIESESYLADGKVETARKILEEAVQIPAGAPGSLQHQMAGKLKLRLAQVYYSKKDTFNSGDTLVDTIKATYPNDGELVGDAFFAKALPRIGTGRARDAIAILRDEVQKPYPNSSVAKALASDPRFSKFLKEGTDAQGNKIYLLKDGSEINESDWAEAFKVAIVRSGEGPLERKVAYGAAGGLGAAAALALAPEPVATKVAAGLIAIGVGVGLLWERFVTGVERRDEIYDAYQTGLSPVSNEQYFLGLAMLGADVAMLVGAGLVGQVAKGAVREGLAWGASRIASPLLRTGLTVYGDDVAIWAGRGLLYGAEASAGSFSTYGFYRLERTVFMGETFHWDTKEALEWLAMGEFIGMAARTPFLGTAVAKNPLFQRGPLKNIVVDGEIVGKTTSEGLAAKWLVDATVGLSALYAVKQAVPSLKAEGAEKDPRFLEYLTQNLWMMGLIHVGGVAGKKLTGGSTEALVYRMEKRADAYFAEAKEKFMADPPDWGSGWPRLQPAYAMAGMPSPGFRFDPIFNKPTIRPSVIISLSSYRLGNEQDLRVESAGKTHPNVEPERIEELRETIKSELKRNSDWRRISQGDFSFIDNLSPEQLLAMEAVLKIDRSTVGEPAQLLKRMKETGFLDAHLLSLPPESLRAFASAANSRAGEGQGRSFAERIFYDYMEWKRPSGRLKPARESGVLFEKINDPSTGTQRTRFDLVMEAYYWMQVGAVTGSRVVIDGITGEYFDSHRVRKPDGPTGWGEKGWTSIESENQWRGNIDEAIRMGQVAKKNSWRPFHPEALLAVDSLLGTVDYYALDGGKAQDPLTPDGFRNGGWGEEYKSTYHQGVPADFAFSAMKNEVSFRNQVLKYAAAVRQGKLDGVIYRITAKSIDPLVKDYIEKHIPNVQIIRYDSITDTQGTVVLNKMEKAPTERPQALKEARERADRMDFPFLIEDGKFTTYHLPPGVPDAQGTAFREQLSLYTDTLTLQTTASRDLGARLVGRARRQVEWLGRIYDHLDAAGRQDLDSKVTSLTTKLDSELPALKDEVSKAKRIAERIDALTRETVKKHLPEWDRASLGITDGTGKPLTGLDLLEDLPGQFKVYLTTPEARGPFQASALRNRLSLPVGTRIYLEGLTLDQVELSFPPPSSKGSKGKVVDTKRGSVLNFNAPLELEQNPSLEKKTDDAGREYYEVKKEMVLEKGGYDIPYLGDNPLYDFYQPAAVAAGAKP